ncbi:two-component system response regulator VicR [Enterococcus rotai]|uniref:OmpR/PhoB-type domain-containing protein n=1 Tax=Enterococcus rotai TaxID=118060 RepID=A0A0U2VGR0_9ENTE|nr:winged helix-turn-helix domain-containing protein [Enterococcus rotai]ALS36828.1 hypothetical protein ATZ35_06560 [Enterococcus rotai]
MSDRLGIIEINSAEDQESIFNGINNGINENYKYEFINIENEEQLEEIAGLMIFANKIVDYIEVCQWLLSLRNRKPLFVWIVCKDYDDNMKELYCKLATNAMIEVIQYDKNNQHLMSKVKQAIDFQNSLLSYKEQKERKATFYLDSQSLKIVVEDKDIYLTRSEFKLFTILYDNLDNPVSYEKIIEIIWPTIDSESYKYRLANLVFHLRKKLGRQPNIDIQIIRTKGYLLKIK